MTKKRIKNQNSSGFKIAAYLRVSTEEQAENPEGSIKNQEQRLREYVDLKNLVEPFGEIVAVYSDPGVSAKDMRRPGFQKMLKAIENHQVNLVLVTELSRFSRSTKDFAILQEFLEGHQCKFMSIRENFDTSGAAGAMVLNLMASIAEFERRQTGERIAHSFLARAKRGLYNGGSVPLGYKLNPDNPGVLLIDEEEALLVKLFFQTFLKEKTLAATAKKLNDEGVKLPRFMKVGGVKRARFIGYNTVYRILRNKAYIGIKVYNTKKGATEEVKASWSPLIEKPMFDLVQKRLDANCSRRKTHENKFPYTLSGLIRCKHCQEMMSGASATNGSGKKVGYYEHVATRKNETSLNEVLLNHKPRRIPALKIEPLVWQEVQKFVLDESFAEKLLIKAKELQSKDSKEEELEILSKKINQVARQVSVLTDRIAKLPESLDPQGLLEKLEGFQKEQRCLEAERSEFESKRESKGEILSTDSLKIFREGIRDLIKKAENELDLQSKIMKLVIHRIEVLPDGFEIYFHVGAEHYNNALEEKSSGAAFFVSFGQKQTPPSLKKLSASEFKNLFGIARSSRFERPET